MVLPPPVVTKAKQDESIITHIKSLTSSDNIIFGWNRMLLETRSRLLLSIKIVVIALMLILLMTVVGLILFLLLLKIIK